MTEQNLEKVKKWFEELDATDLWRSEYFDNLIDKPNNVKPVAALVFMTSKLKPEYKNETSFLHAEHDKLLIGRNLDIFEDFTKEDVKMAVILGIFLDDEGFAIFVGM